MSVATQAIRLTVLGRVQGVGFLPTVYRLAHEMGLAGTVCNTSKGVIIELEGPPENLQKFQDDFEEAMPSLALITALEVEAAKVQGLRDFVILPSESGGSARALIPFDVATCPDCLKEFANPKDRRYHYPFINCTLCGPRYTIIESVPYDRPKTSMKVFPMCSRCQSEYEDPTDRRYHAQPNACPDCGPRLWLVDAEGEPIEGEPIEQARDLLRQGKVLALRGLGGFHLAVDAENEEAVLSLRQRKRRGPKPFAVMTADKDGLAHFARSSDAEWDLLESVRRPIVLVDKRQPFALAEALAPGNPRVGVMLPYTPIHLSLIEGFRALVMTSGNLAEEPIAKDNDEALKRLADLADAFLLHDRDILMSCDDSVAFVDPGGAPAFVRRSRGWAPDPLSLPGAPDGILAVGAEMKNTFCLTRDGQAFLSQHVGDLENLETFEHFERCLEHMRKLLGVEIRAVACDLHPDYMATRYAESLADLEPIRIQHHHAHMVSAMVENGLEGDAIGLCLDGTGFGPDGSIWGGEILCGSAQAFRRVARLQPFRLPGGDAAVRQPWRSLLGVWLSELDEEAALERLSGLGELDPKKVRAVAQACLHGVNAPWTSSLGRLFDAVSAQLSICTQVLYDGQAAIELEAVATGQNAADLPSLTLDRHADLWQLSPHALLKALLERKQAGVAIGPLAAGFHRSVVQGFVEACCVFRQEGGPEQVVFSGGCFMNRLLDAQLAEALQSEGFVVYRQRAVPANDGGLCLGQAAIAAAQILTRGQKG